VPRVRRSYSFLAAFTLVELLVVTAIVSLLAAMLFPVFQRVQESGRRAGCLSNEKQFGLAILAYVQDNDEKFPNGINQDAGGRYWPGEGWAGQCFPYTRSLALLRCPDDPTVSYAPGSFVVSYGYNIDVAGPVISLADSVPAGFSLASLAAPARSILLFDVAGVTANAADSREGTGPGGREGNCFLPDGTGAGSCFSASGNGLDNRLYAQDAQASLLNQYATGLLGGRLPPVPQATQFQNASGRHGGGSNFLMADGHALWLRGGTVSTGINANAEDCPQDNIPPRAGCAAAPGSLSAAGTGDVQFRATFSTK